MTKSKAWHRISPSPRRGIFYHALAWRARPDAPEGAEVFTLQSGSFRDLLLLVGLASPLEIVPVHLILHRWSAVAAWVATGLGLYGALCCVAVARSLRLLPSFVGRYEAVIRFGLLLTLRIPRGSIESIGDRTPPGVRAIPRGSSPNVCLKFKKPLEGELIYGMHRPFAAIALVADDPEGFSAAMRRMAYCDQ